MDGFRDEETSTSSSPLAGDLHDDLTSVALLIACRYKTVQRKLRDQITPEIKSLPIFCIRHRDHRHLIALSYAQPPSYVHPRPSLFANYNGQFLISLPIG